MNVFVKPKTFSNLMVGGPPTISTSGSESLEVALDMTRKKGFPVMLA